MLHISAHCRLISSFIPHPPCTFFIDTPLYPYLMQRPTCTDIRVRSVSDALVIFYAVSKGILPIVSRRLDSEERRCIRSGSVYVWEERGPDAEATGVKSSSSSWQRCHLPVFCFDLAWNRAMDGWYTLGALPRQVSGIPSRSPAGH